MEKQRSIRAAMSGLVIFLIAGSIASAAPRTKHRTGAIGFVSTSSATTSAVAGPVPKGWLQVVNYYRGLASVPPVTENPAFSSRNAKHAKWMVKNQSIAHGETPGSPFYSAQGNAAGAHSNLLSGPWGQTARASIEQWLVAPFHAVGVLDPLLKKSGYADYQESRPGGFPYAAALDVLGDRSATPAPTTWPVRFPGPNQKVFLNQYPGTEFPSPLTSSGCNGFTPPTGLPIYLMTSTNPSVTSSSFQQNGSPLPFCIFDENTYTNPDSDLQALGRGALDQRNAIVLIPKDPLESNKTYDVSITSNGTAVSWSFEVGDVVPPTTVVKVPANGSTRDQDKFHKIKGTATGNPVRVEVQLFRQIGTLCKFWTGRRFTAKRGCSERAWLKADGTSNWSLSIPKLPAGNNYVAGSRGIDKVGNVEGFSGGNYIGFSIKP